MMGQCDGDIIKRNDYFNREYNIMIDSLTRTTIINYINNLINSKIQIKKQIVIDLANSSRLSRSYRGSD